MGPLLSFPVAGPAIALADNRSFWWPEMSARARDEISRIISGCIEADLMCMRDHCGVRRLCSDREEVFGSELRQQSSQLDHLRAGCTTATTSSRSAAPCRADALSDRQLHLPRQCRLHWPQGRQLAAISPDQLLQPGRLARRVCHQHSAHW